MNNKFRISDRVILVLLSGTISAAIANIFGYISKFFYNPTIIMPEAAGELFIRPDQFNTLLGLVFGNMMSFGMGGLHAFAFVTILDITGWRHFWLKSFAVTNLGWLAVVGMLFRVLGVASKTNPELLSSVLFYGAHLVYLTVSAFIISRYGVPINELTENIGLRTPTRYKINSPSLTDANEHGISQVVIGGRMAKFLERTSKVLKKGPSEPEQDLAEKEKHIAELERKVGQLIVEVDCMKKNRENKLL